MDRGRKHATPWRSTELVLTALFWSGVALGFPEPALPASIFPSGAPDYQQCQVGFAPFVATHLYVLASGYPFWATDPPLAKNGITSAEFRIAGLRSDQFITSVQPGPGGVVEGDFFGAGGRISFPECHPWEATSCLVRLLDIIVVPLAQVPDGTIEILPLASSCNEAMSNTFLGLCDTPATTQLCALTTGMCYNVTSYCPYCPLSRPAGSCTLPIDGATWFNIKALYR